MNTPSSSSPCPRCGSTLEAQGLCPKCLMAQAAMATEDPTMPAAPSPLRSLEDIAEAFPELEVLELIGRGGMGVVYKARQKSLNRLVALKLLAPERVQQPLFAERFAHEAQALAALNHPNIVTVHDFGQTGEFYYLLMEFVDGVNLRQAMSAGRFTPEQALAIVPPVCEALHYAHAHGIVHRDIKPENLLLDKDCRVKIADFGIAKMLGANASETVSQPVGTPRYMAPEQAGSELRVDHRADIYSLGVVLYELLTGELPGSKLEAPSRKVQIDVRLDAVVLRALSERPELRWQTAAEFRTQVETIVDTPAGSTAPRPEALRDPQQCLYHAMGFHTLWGQRLLKLSFVGFLGFLGFVPGLERLSVLSVFLAFAPLAAIVEKAHGWFGKGRPHPSAKWQHKVSFIVVAAIVIVIPVQAWLIQAFKMGGRSLEPEIPPGSRVLVWKLGKTYAPGDIIAHRHSDQVWIARVVKTGDGTVDITRNLTPPETLPLSEVIGKVISVYWRARPQPVTFKTFHSVDPVIDKTVEVAPDQSWLVNSTQPQVVHLFELPMPEIDDGVVFYRAKMRAENLEGQAFLEMWCRLPGRGEFFSRGLDNVLKGTSDWVSFETPFFLKKGEKADLLKLNVSVQGKGKIWIKDVEVRAQGAGMRIPPGAAAPKKTASP